MSHTEDKNMNKEVTRLLNNLPKINAPLNFEAELSKRLAKKEEKKYWFDKILSPQLVPSAALAVTAVLILFLLKGTVNEMEDPFQLIPKLREESIVMQDGLGIPSTKNIPAEKKMRNETSNSSDLADNKSEIPKSLYRADSNDIQVSSLTHASIDRISVHTTNYIPDQAVVTAGGLNYKAVRLGEEEQRQVDLLREKVVYNQEILRKN